MDRRKELATQQRQLVPELKQMTDDQIAEKYVTQFPQFQEYFKLPEDPNKQIIDAIRRDYPEAQSMTDMQILQQRKQHQELSWMDPTAPWAPGTQLEWPLEWMPSTADDTWIMWIPKFWRVKPLAPFDPIKDVWAPNVWKMIANIPWSAVNVASDVLNMVIDPVDTAVWLLKIIWGAWANLGKWALKIFADDQDVENRVAIGIDRMKRKWWVLWQIASILESSEEMADAVWTALEERYGSAEKIARTMTEDPLGMVSDIAWTIEWWWTLLKRWGKASKASKLAKLWDEIAEFGNASDPYALTMAWWAKWAQKTVESFTTSKTPWEPTMIDRAIASYNWMDADTIRTMKDNADLIKQRDEWQIDERKMRQKVVDIVNKLESDKKIIGSIYNEAYKDKTTFDTKEIISDIVENLKQQWVIFNEFNKIIDFDWTNPWMMWLNDSAMKAIKSSYTQAIKDLSRQETIDVEKLHAIRRNLNSTIYQVDAHKSKQAPGIQKVVDWINNKLKKVPWFAKADQNFAQAITEFQQVRKYLATKDPEWKLQMKWTLKSLLSESNIWKFDVIERYYPWIKRELQAMVAYNDYLNTRYKHKVWLYGKASAVPAWIWWSIWFAIAWPFGALLWAWVSSYIKNMMTDPKWFKNRVVKKLGNKVAKKIEAGKALSRVEKARMEFEVERLLAKPQLALEYKPDTKTEKVQVVTPEWVVKWQPGAQTLDKKAIVGWKIIQEKTINASPIKIPGKRNQNLPKQVKETWQENVKEPINKIKEAWMEARKAEMQRKAEIKNAKQAKLIAYEKATWPTETNVSQFKKWMITPDGIITETWFNGRKAYYKVEWDGNFQYRYEWKAKQVSPVKIPWPINVKKAEAEEFPERVRDEKDEEAMRVNAPELAKHYLDVDKAENVPFRTLDELDTIASEILDLEEAKNQGKMSQKAYDAITEDPLAREAMQAREAKERMENEINKLWYGDVEAKLTKEILRIESMEQNVWFVAWKKIKDKEYKQLNTVEFMGKRERMIEKIQEELWLDAKQAKDWYDDKAYNARELKERYQTKKEWENSPKEVKESTLSPEQAEKRIRKYFTEKELPIIFEEKIMTPRGQEAYGKYHDWAITLVKDPIKSTPDHESLHAYFDMFTTKNRQRAILDEVKRKQKIKDDIEAEEWLADGFADFVAKRETFTWKIKWFFSDVRKGIKAVFWQEDAVRSLYKDIINKKRPDTTVRTNPKRAPRNEAQGIPYLTTKPLQDIMSEIKWDSVSAEHLKNMLGRQYKKQEMLQVMEAIRVAEEKWGKLSKAETLEVMRWEILPLEIEDTARYADYNKLYDNSTYDFDWRPKTYWTTHIYVVPTIDLTSYNNHFSEPDYFWHIRVEDLSAKDPGNNTARVIEVQSDLFQRWNETMPRIDYFSLDIENKWIEILNPFNNLELDEYIKTWSANFMSQERLNAMQQFRDHVIDKSWNHDIINFIFSEQVKKELPEKVLQEVQEKVSEYNKMLSDIKTKKYKDHLIPKEVSQLESYANKWAYRKRMVWQEMIYQFTQGKEKIQFPDGVTIAKIEGHDIPIFWPSEITDLWKWYIVQNEYFNIVVNKIISDQKIENDIFDAYVEMWEFQKVWDWREDIDGDKYTKWQMMERAMESYMNLYWIEYQWALQFSLIDPAMFQDFLEIHRWYEILKNIKEKYPHRFADQKALKNTWWIRDDETAKTAINKMRPEHKTIASFYQTELIPYLQKQFWGEFVNEDWWRWLEIDMKKVFGEQKKLGVPAFQTKDVYKEIDESFNRMLDQQMQYKKESGGRFTDWGIIAWIQNYLYNEYPQYKAHINDRIMEAIKKYDIKEKFEQPTTKISERERDLYTRSRKNAKWNTIAEKLYDIYQDTVLEPNVVDWLKEAWIPLKKSDVTQYYDLFFKNLPNNVKNHDMRAWFDREIKRAYDYGYITEEKASVYKRVVSMLQEKQKWVPKFQTKNQQQAVSNRSVLQEYLKKNNINIPKEKYLNKQLKTNKIEKLYHQTIDDSWVTKWEPIKRSTYAFGDIIWIFTSKNIEWAISWQKGKSKYTMLEISKLWWINLIKDTDYFELQSRVSDELYENPEKFNQDKYWYSEQNIDAITSRILKDAWYDWVEFSKWENVVIFDSEGLQIKKLWAPNLLPKK